MSTLTATPILWHGRRIATAEYAGGVLVRVDASGMADDEELAREWLLHECDFWADEPVELIGFAGRWVFDGSKFTTI